MWPAASPPDKSRATASDILARKAAAPLQISFKNYQQTTGFRRSGQAPPVAAASHAPGRIWPVLLEGSSSYEHYGRVGTAQLRRHRDYKPFVERIATLLQDLAGVGAVSWPDRDHGR